MTVTLVPPDSSNAARMGSHPRSACVPSCTSVLLPASGAADGAPRTIGWLVNAPSQCGDSLATRACS